MNFKIAAFAALAGLGLATSAGAANISSYYLFDGDSSVGYEIKNGALVNTFQTFSLGYPVAIRDTIWLGQRDDAGAREYGLNGVATGNTSAGGNAFSQLLDGATGSNGKNYGVECCGGTNSVTVANADWTNQQVLFDLPFNAGGVAFDTTNNTLYVIELFGVRVNHYSLGGALLDAFDLRQSLVGLAYEEATSTFWGFARGTNNLVQFDRAGNILQDVDIPNLNVSNPFGGEMRVTGTPPIPEPGTLALLGLGLLGGLGVLRRRSR